MKTIYERSCELLISDLKEKIRVEQKPGRSSHRIKIEFGLRKVPSSVEMGLEEIHLICYDNLYPSTIMFLAALRPTTGEWVTGGSQFSSSVEKFMNLCIDQLEPKGEKDPIRVGMDLVEICYKEFNKLSK